MLGIWTAHYFQLNITTGSYRMVSGYMLSLIYCLVTQRYFKEIYNKSGWFTHFREFTTKKYFKKRMTLPFIQKWTSNHLNCKAYICHNNLYLTSD